MASSETPEPQKDITTREVTVIVPEHRADQFLALARRVLAVWEYRDAYGEPFGGRRRHRRGRHFGPGGHHGHGRCAPRGQDTAATEAGGGVETA